MATTNMDSLPTGDAESKMESEEKSEEKSDYPKNDPNNDGGNIGDAESTSIDQGAPSEAKHDKRAKRGAGCNGTRAFNAITLFTLIMIVPIIGGLGGYVSQLHMELRHVSDRVDRFESRCPSGCTTSTVNETRPNLDVEGGDLLAQISNLSKEIERMKATLENSIQTVRATHEKDMDEIRINVSMMLTQINSSLTRSLLLFAAELNKDVQRELSSVRNHSLSLAENVSALTDQAQVLEGKSDELEANVIALDTNLNERLSRLVVNVSSSEELLRDVSVTQTGHTTTIEQTRRNISLLEDRFEQQLSDTMEHLTATLSDFNGSLSLIDTSHRAYLSNLSSELNDLSNELIVTEEMFFANQSDLREEITKLGVDLDNTNVNLTDLSSIQKRLLLDLTDVKEVHSGNISAIGQSLVHLSEELDETNEHLENLSTIQDGLQRDLDLANEALQSNISALEHRFSGEINRTAVQLRSQYTELELNLSTTRVRLETNISALQESNGLLQGDLGSTKANLESLSSRHVNLQSDYNASKHDFYTTKASMERNVTQLRTLIRNHSSILGEHSRLFGDAAQSRSTLLNRIDETSNSVRSHDTLISGIRSNVTVVQNSVTGLRGTLTANTDSLNTRIDDHVDWIQHTLEDQSQRLTNFDSRIRHVEQELASDAVHVVPFGFLLLSIIALLVCYVTF